MSVVIYVKFLAADHVDSLILCVKRECMYSLMLATAEKKDI